MSKIQMRVWDVKHGNAIFIRTPNNKNIVIDLGRGDYSENSDDRSPLETLRDHYNINTIHHLVITHPHRDHIDDILNLQYFHVQTLSRIRNLDRQDMLNEFSDRDRPKLERYFQLDSSYIFPVAPENDTTNPANYGGLEIKHFQTPHIPGLNNQSLFITLKYEGMKILIPGDNECASLIDLLQREEFKLAIKDCAILIAPHHGRESAYHPEFVSIANPLLTVISDGSLCDTSANTRYSQNSQGWDVWKQGQKTKRYLLTTNSDGEIYIDFGLDSGQRFLQVELKRA